MALTMTRTRTQTALTTLCKHIANVHGELQFVEWALGLRRVGRGVLLQRRQQLLEQRTALYTTLQVFDPELDPTRIGELMEWMKPYGRKRGPRCLARYMRASVSNSAG